MRGPEPSPILVELAESVGASRVDRAVDLAMRALQTKVASLDIIQSAALGAARHFDPVLQRPPRGLVALAAAASLQGVLPPRLHPLPALQAVVLAASEKKAPRPARPPLIVSGEITHLGRSFLLAARDGNLPEAEAIFLGIVDEREERRMAGDMLFRAAAEDMAEGGLKLVVSVKLWQLARALRFRDARVILRPAVQYLVAGPRDASSYRMILSVLGKDWVDLEGLATAGKTLDIPARERVSTALSAASKEACAAGILSLLRDGYAATSIAEALSVEASRHLLAPVGTPRDAAHGLALAHSARFVSHFTRSPEKLYVLFQTALRLHGPPTGAHIGPFPEVAGDGEPLTALAGDLEARRAERAASRTQSYLARGLPPKRLLEVLADYACRDSSLLDEGLHILLADAGTAEFTATGFPEPAMALARSIASAPADWAAYRMWAPLLGP